MRFFLDKPKNGHSVLLRPLTESVSLQNEIVNCLCNKESLPSFGYNNFLVNTFNYKLTNYPNHIIISSYSETSFYNPHQQPLLKYLLAVS